jgi:hypothetical protein
VKDENGDLLADSQNILDRWRNRFSQLLNVQNVSDVRQILVHTAEPLVPSHLEVEIVIAKLKNYKSSRSDQIPTEVIQAIHELINSIWNWEELPDQWKESIIVSIHQTGDKSDCSNCQGGGYYCYQLHTKFYQISFSQG